MKLDLGALRIDVPEGYRPSTLVVAGPDDSNGVMHWKRQLSIRLSANEQATDGLAHATTAFEQRLAGSIEKINEPSSGRSRVLEVRHRSNNVGVYTFASIAIAHDQVRTIELTVLDEPGVVTEARQQFSAMIGSLSAGTALARSTSAAIL